MHGLPFRSMQWARQWANTREVKDFYLVFGENLDLLLLFLQYMYPKESSEPLRLDLIRGTRSWLSFHPRIDVHGLAFASFRPLIFLGRSAFFFLRHFSNCFVRGLFSCYFFLIKKCKYCTVPIPGTVWLGWTKTCQVYKYKIWIIKKNWQKLGTREKNK